jgi:hypothetical protein
MDETKRSTRNFLLSMEQVDVVNLELCHIRALAGIAIDQADQSNEQIMTALMLLRERVGKIESLMQHAWDQSNQKAAA